MGTPETSREPYPDGILDDVGGMFGMGAISGSTFHFIKGLYNSPNGERLSGGVQAVRMNAPQVGGSIAIWGGLFSTFDCSMVYLCQKEDPRNSILAGSSTGGSSRCARVQVLPLDLHSSMASYCPSLRAPTSCSIASSVSHRTYLPWRILMSQLPRLTLLQLSRIMHLLRGYNTCPSNLIPLTVLHLPLRLHLRQAGLEGFLAVVKSRNKRCKKRKQESRGIGEL